MSQSNDDREGLSPSPANILDFLGEDDGDDDLFEPASEESDITASMDGDDEEVEFSGQIIDTVSEPKLIVTRCARTAYWH